ncbi:MAG TPA: hypothetical protein VKR41_05075 [Puia sp.]|nr:hypothetical protein [Puia sp.]
MTTNHFIKRTLLVACCLLTISAGVFAGPEFSVGDKLLQVFQQTFPDAKQVKWVEEPAGYEVSFRQNETLTKVVYDKDAHFVSSLRYYSEKNLPVSILCQLQKKYSGKTVWGVTEQSTESSTEYYVKLVDDRNWYTVRSDAEGNMQTIERYKKD